MSEKFVRKNLRLKEYDYNNAGYYFVTICTQDKKCLLGRIDSAGDANPCATNAMIKLSPYGIITEKYLLSMEEHDNNIRLHKYCIMPNHIHMIIEIVKANNFGTQWAASPTANHVSQAIRSLKCLTSRESGIHLWQRSFYDHIIRNEQDYLRIWEYIDTNPIKWANDEYYKQ